MLRMLKAISLLVAVLAISGARCVHGYENHGYPYSYDQCQSNPIPDTNGNGFYKSHCTSYVAHVLDTYGIPFSNTYKSVGWHDGGNWDDAARSVGIPVDKQPLP